MTTDNVSPRAAEVLALHKDGQNPTQIGQALGISSQAVHGHLRRLREKELLPPDPKAKTKAAKDTNGRSFSAEAAFAEVRASIERQQRDLDTYIIDVDREIERLDDRKAELYVERENAEKAKARLVELEGTVKA